MPVQTMTLKEAAKVLGVSPDTVRHRYRKGELPGKWDNQGRILVDIDTEAAAGRKANSGRKSKEFQHGNKVEMQHGNGMEISALGDYVQTLKEELSAARIEADRLRGLAEQLPGEKAQAAGLRAEVAELRERLSGTGLDRDRERQEAAAQIEDLRRRLDAEGAERRELTAILKDQRAKGAVGQERRGWFGRMFGARAG